MNKPKITIVKNQPNNSSKITIIKKKPFTIPKESTYKILNIDNLCFRHVLQKTPANCGPLSIINWLNALESINQWFKYPSDFPTTSTWIRELLWKDGNLRSTIRWPYWFEVTQDNHALVTDIIYNLIDKLCKTTNLKIIWDRLKSDHWIKPEDIENVIDHSKRIITAFNNHYVSYVKIDNDTWVWLDSLIEPYKITDIALKRIIKTTNSWEKFIWVSY
jgi:hypothetical protein